MPRRLRLALADVAVHLIQRGNNRGACFFGDQDYVRYLDYLVKFAPEFWLGDRIRARLLATALDRFRSSPTALDRFRKAEPMERGSVRGRRGGTPGARSR